MKVPLTINDYLDRALTVYPDRAAIIDEPDQPGESWGTLTFAQLAERAKAQAAGLDKLGIGVGERVAMVSHNSARLFASFFGVSCWGRVFVPINFRLNHHEISYIVEHCGASILLIDPELEDDLKHVDHPRKYIMGAESDAELYLYDTEPTPWEPDEDTTATINYTSGTTARPKGVEQTHRSLWLNAATFGWHAGVNDYDNYLHTLPMFHCNGWGMPYATVGMGVTNVALRKVDGAEILRRIRDHNITLMCGAPAVASMVLDALADWEGEIPGKGTLRMVMAGAPPPTSVIEQVETKLGWEFIQIYGLTETAPLLTVNRNRSEYEGLSPTEKARKLNRAGAPALGVRMQTSDEGEIMARSNVVLRGYWDQPDQTAEAIRDGWFHTGDGGFIDDDSYVNIADRKKDVIITGGENVSSIEIEDVLFNHPQVAEVAVIGVPSEKWGEEVKALVVLAPGAEIDAAGLVAYTRDHLAGYKCPKSIEIRDELARTATGKLQKFKLREPYWEGLDRQVN